ncbi:FKBP-type peptidyl-prolyl cis-trans isomerase N-terminal domain-containing protein [Pseudomonas cerasi]
MTGKYTVPCALSGAAALVVACLGISKLHAAEREAPAVLNFAISYMLEQQHSSPSVPEPHSVVKEPGKGVKPEHKYTTVVTPTARTQLAALRREINEKTRQIAQKNGTISTLEQQILALEKSTSHPAINEAPHLSPADREVMLGLVKDLRQVFSLHPTPDSLMTKLAQAKDQLKEVQLAEAAMRSQLKTLTDGKDRLVAVHEEALKQQIEQRNVKITELETHLSSSRQDIDKITADRDNLAANEQKLAAEKASEKQAFDTQKQQLLQQIAQKSPAESQLEASVKQREALQQQLAEAQQFKSALQSDKDRLQTQLAESQLMAKSLQTKMDLVQLQQPAAGVVTAGTVPDESPSKEGHQGDDKRLPQLQAKLDAALAELDTVKKQKSDVKSASNLPDITAEQLTKKSAREGYAIGVSLGDEILQMQSDNNRRGTVTERNLMLAGIVDAFHGQSKLSTDVLRNILSEVSQRENKDQENRVTHLDEATKKYLDNFTKKKNTKKSPSGFWYNINYQGDEPIPKNATLDVVVKESLTNGDVVTDMDASGTMLTQPLSDFPPVFREALEKLKNHGSITIVVPPELAYKDKGYPPKVPPNATIVYDIRISEVYR